MSEQLFPMPETACSAAVPSQGSLSLSRGQKALYTQGRLDPECGAYTMIYLWEVPGCHVDTFRDALHFLGMHHPIWRTVFTPCDGEPVGTVGAQPPPLQVRDLPAMDDAAWEAWLQAQVHTPYPENLPPVSWWLVCAPQRPPVLMWRMQHFAADGWSTARALKDLGAVYTALRQGRTPTLPEASVTHEAYLAAQEAYQASDRCRQDAAFWQDTLAGTLPVLQLNPDHPRPPVAGFHGDFYRFDIPDTLRHLLHMRCTETGVSPFKIFLTAFQIFLARCSGQRDIVVGVPTAGRDETWASLFGYYVNPVVMRARLTNQPFRTILDAQSLAVDAALRHGAYPFPMLSTLLDIDRDPGRTPIYQAQFVFENPNRYAHREAPMVTLGADGAERWQVADMAWRRVLTKINPDPFDLTLKMVKLPNAYYGIFEYRTDLFLRDTFAAMADSFNTLLEGLLRTPEQPIFHVPWLPADAPLARLTHPTTAPDEGAALHDRVLASCARHGDRTALCAETPSTRYGTALSYRLLAEDAVRLAGFLRRAYGVQPGARIGLFLDRTPDSLVTLLAILQLGCAYVPLDPKFPEDRLAFIAADADLHLVVTQESLLSRLFAHDCPVHVLEAHRQAVAAEGPAAFPAVPLEADAYILYTSGSTGKPKGVAVPHRALVNFLTAMLEKPGFGHDDVLLALTTFAFDIAGLELWLPLLAGGRIVMTGVDTAVDGARILELTAREGVTVLQATPVTWRILLAAGMGPHPHLKGLTGGEPLPPDLAADLMDTVGEMWNLYGPTETTIYSTAWRVPDGTTPISIGHPIARTDLHIVDPYLQPLPPGVPGELLIGGDGLARGYHRRPALTAAQFVPHPFGPPGSRLYRSGDLAELSRRGRLTCLGRMDHQVKIRGYRIELGEVEAVLTDHPSVRAAVVVVRTDTPGDPKLVGYLVPHDADGFDAAAVLADMGRRLPAYMLPTCLVPLARFPLTPNKKIDRKALPAPGVALPADTYLAPHTPTEITLAWLWADVLGVDRVGLGRDFFRLGGNSLMIGRLQARLRAAFNLNLDMHLFFIRRTVEDMAELVDALQPIEPSCAAALEYGVIA